MRAVVSPDVVAPDDVTSGVAAAASRLQDAALSRQPCTPVRDLIGPGDVDAAYAVQQLVTAARLAGGARVVGRKIGLTADAVRRQLGVSQPDFGTLFADMAYGSGEPIPLARLMQPRIEAEVAFVLASDLDVPDPCVADVLRATGFVLAAVEVVDSRIAGWDLRISDTVADAASSGAFVLGTVPHQLSGLDLAQVGVVVEGGGEALSVGAGAACMGSPVIAVMWLAREAVRRGAPLRAGEVVLSGALGPVVDISGPGRYRARFDGLGEVDVVFEEDPA